MIRERARLPELEYIFKHELTRELPTTPSRSRSDACCTVKLPKR